MSNENINIVYLDDEEDLLNLFKAMLDLPENYTVSTFSNRDEAAEFLSKNKTCCLFVDWRMPGGDGLSFVNENAASLTATNIFLITGDLDLPETAKNAFKVVFSKPVDYQELKEVILLHDC